jgi:hypothetical protein
VPKRSVAKHVSDAFSTYKMMLAYVFRILFHSPVISIRVFLNILVRFLQSLNSLPSCQTLGMTLKESREGVVLLVLDCDSKDTFGRLNY